ncbi:hypothetical protein PT974_00851 [Cladobotryum mycophilum]|uniref:DUF3669 domain-containing protein n=1 Tax=Cladobotryum mycophilum TaxID=491253 RepID=A0ABR0T220_9HYPO
MVSLKGNGGIRLLESTALEKLPSNIILQQSLDIGSVISTSSSFAVCAQLASSNPELQTAIIQIGKGLQGAIFEQVGRLMAMKKENPGNEALSTNLQREYLMHHRAMSTFDTFEPLIKSNVHVPRLASILSSHDSFLEENLGKFPDGYRDFGTLVMMERILPLPKVVRSALVTQFYPSQGDVPLDPATIKNILDDTPNKHCLVRTYLGKRNGAYRREAFSLRNFPLYLGSMEQLGLNTTSLAASMGKAYVVMHWGACINGDDVEFVLGTSAASGESANTSPGPQHRIVKLWLLDFGQCEPVDLSQDTEVVYQAFKV